jgi:hypothetical protein
MLEGFRSRWNNRFLMGVLYSRAHFDKQIQPLLNAQFFAIAVFGDGETNHVFHYKVRLAFWRRTGIKHLGDCRMLHDGQRLPLGLKALGH